MWHIVPASVVTLLVAFAQGAWAQTPDPFAEHAPISDALADCLASFDQRQQTAPIIECGLAPRETCLKIAFLYHNPFPYHDRCFIEELAYWYEVEQNATQRIVRGPQPVPEEFLNEIDTWWPVTDEDFDPNALAYNFTLAITSGQNREVMVAGVNKRRRRAVVAALIARRMDEIFCAAPSSTYYAPACPE
ncbi:MAG: hypothetical protein AAFQ09_04010 [Pseudomonadota bacterium]